MYASVLFVGHEPDLSSSIELLTGASCVKMREGSVCRIEFDGSPEAASGAMTLLLDPDLYTDGEDT